MDSISERLQQAVALHQSGRLLDAAKLYERVLAEAPDNPDALHLLGLVKRRSGALADGIRLLERALEQAPHLAVARFNLANALLEIGHLEEATCHLRAVLRQHPDHGGAMAALGRLLLQRGALDEADMLLKRACGAGADARLQLAIERAQRYRAIVTAATNPTLPSGLIVRGVFQDSSGYAYKVRQFVRHLVAAGVRVQLMDLLHAPMDNLSPAQQDPLFQTLDAPVRAKAVLNFTTPIMVERLPGLQTVTYSVFEATRIPALWAVHSRLHDHTIVATPSSRDAWVASGHPEDRISICPEGVEPIDSRKAARMEVVDATGRRLSSYPTRILNISDFNPRKNLPGLLRVWLSGTRTDDQAALVLKIGKGPDSSGAFRTLITDTARSIGVPLDAAAPIFLVDATLSDHEMLSLFAACTHYWSLSHGEGWDLPMAQAGAMGLTLIAPRHSAYMAYLDDQVAHLLPCFTGPATGSYAGLDWWFPDEVAARDLLGRIIRAPDTYRRSAQTYLRTNMSWERSTQRLINVLSGIGALA